MPKVEVHTERNRMVENLRKSGMRHGEIVRHTGLSRNVVSGILTRAGLTNKDAPQSIQGPRPRYPASFRLKVVKAAGGKSYKDVAREWGLAPDTVGRWFRSLA